MDNARQLCRGRSMGTYRLDSAAARAEANPGTFRVPSRSALAGIRAGDYVKLLFLGSPGGGAERMWVRVTGGTFSRGWTGVLDNRPVTLTGIQLGDPVRFSAHHVAAITRADGRAAGGLVDDGQADTDAILRAWARQQRR